jgi:hypothetical protein
MKKFIPHILIAILIAAAAFSPLDTHKARAICNPLNGGCVTEFGASALQSLAEGGAVVMLTVTSWILWLGGTLLNFVFNVTVLQMASTVRNISAIDVGWSVFRDLANMLFIFVLLYVAILTIVNASTHALQQTLVRLIIAALLINFSLFFTKVVIDASNIVAAEFYRNIQVNGEALSGNTSADGGLSDAFMQPLKLQGLYNKNTGASAASLLADANKKIVVGIAGSIFMFIAAFIFLVATALFAVRFVVLVLVMVLSPFAVVGYILPGLQQYARRWSSALFNQAIFAPIYMMLTWLVVQIINNGNFLPGSDPNLTFADAIGRDGFGAANAALLLNFFIVIVFMIASLAIAKGLATSGVPMANQAISFMTGAVGGAVLGNTGRFGRRFAGKWGTELLEDDERRRALEERAAKGERFARLKLATAHKAATSSFDARNIGLVGSAAGLAGANLGRAGGTGGYKAVMEAKQKPYEERAKRVFGEDRELTAQKLQDQINRADTELAAARAAYAAAPAATPAKAVARTRLAAATTARTALNPLATDLRTKTPEQILKEARDAEKTAKEAYANATDDTTRETARRNMVAAQQRQADLQGERLQKRYSEYLDKLGKEGTTVFGIMSTRRHAQRSAAKSIGKETGTAKMKELDDAIARASEERRNVTDEIADIRTQVRNRGRTAAPTTAEQTRLNDLTARSIELRRAIDEMNKAKRYKIDDPYTFLTNLRTQYRNMP